MPKICIPTINTHRSQKKADNLDEILQKKAKLDKYSKEECYSE